MDPTSSASITSPQTCIFKWLVKDVLKQPTVKVSPLFDMQIGQTKGQILLSLNTNHNLIQISLKPVDYTFDIHHLVELISSALIIFRYGGQSKQQFDKLQFKATGDYIVFEVTRFNFSVLTNTYKDPFEIEVQLNLQAIAPGLTERSRNSPSPSASMSESGNQMVQIVWEMMDVKAQPRVKESDVISIYIGRTKHQVRLSMDINNDRSQMRITLIKTNINQFAELIDNVTVIFQPHDKRPAIKNEYIQVRSVFTDLIYLTTIKSSFAALTANYKVPLSVTLQLGFRKEPKVASSIAPIAKYASSFSENKPYSFYWHIMDYSIFPLTKTSPLFKLQLSNRTTITVQLLLMHQRSKPIKLCLTTPVNKLMSALASSIARVTIKITNANGLPRTFKDIVPELVNDLICFELPENHFMADLTNEFKESFRILFLFHRSSADDASPPTDDKEDDSTLSDQQPIPLQDPPAQIAKITNFPVPVTTIPLSTVFAPNPQSNVLISQLNTLLVDQAGCDVHFDCQGTISIGAHRTILQARSDFFKELLLQHSDQHVFHFKSIDAEAMADALQFIYTGTAPRLASTAERLLSVANLMELPDLHALAENHLLQKSPVNSLPTGREAISKLLDMFELRRMRPQVAGFIRSNMNDLMGNVHFEEELIQRPVLCFELLGLIHGANKMEM